MKNSFHHHLSIFLLACLLPLTLMAATPPKVGDKAPDFTLNTLDHQSVRLSDLTSKGKTVLIVLRGWPGYQCPFCTQQVHDYIKSASEFAGSHARVVMIYPGPADDLSDLFYQALYSTRHALMSARPYFSPKVRRGIEDTLKLDVNPYVAVPESA